MAILIFVLIVIIGILVLFLVVINKDARRYEEGYVIANKNRMSLEIENDKLKLLLKLENEKLSDVDKQIAEAKNGKIDNNTFSDKLRDLQL